VVVRDTECGCIAGGKEERVEKRETVGPYAVESLVPFVPSELREIKSFGTSKGRNMYVHEKKLSRANIIGPAEGFSGGVRCRS